MSTFRIGSDGPAVESGEIDVADLVIKGGTILGGTYGFIEVLKRLRGKKLGSATKNDTLRCVIDETQRLAGAQLRTDTKIAALFRDSLRQPQV